MARISTYPNDTTPMLTDKVIGTDATGGVTKNFTLSFLTDFILDGNKFIDIVPPGHYGIVNPEGDAIEGGGISERFVEESNPDVSMATFSLQKETDGRLLLLVTGFADSQYDISSFVGKTWTATGFQQADQLITTFIGFELLPSGEIRYQFVIEQTGTLASFTGSQTLSSFAVSALDKRTIILSGDVIVAGNITDANGNPIAGSSAPFIVLTALPQTVLSNQIAVLSATEQYYNVSGVQQTEQTINSDFTDITVWLRVGDSASAGGGFRFVFAQTIADSTWTIQHNRGGNLLFDRFVDVTVFENTSGNDYTQVIPLSVVPTSSNEVVVSFPSSQPVAGIALITG